MRNILKSLFLLIALAFSTSAKGQDSDQFLSYQLCLSGFENVNVLSQNDNLLVALENNVYRWDVEAIAVALDTLVAHSEKHIEISLYLMNHGMPQIQIQVPAAKWLLYRKGDLPKSGMVDALHISYKLDKNYDFLKNKNSWNTNLNKVDFVLYPQLAVQNTSLNQIYETQFNLAPAMEVDLWRGMQFTGQLIFPLINDFGPEGDKIRPGFVSLAQNFRMGKSFFARAVLGHFNANRYGVDASVYHPFFNNRVELETNMGLTGSSHFFEGRWIRSSIDQLTWFVKTRYFDTIFNLQAALTYGKYINGDCGLRADLSRHFGPVSIGFFAMYSGGKSNGGFHFTLPLMFKKRKRKRSFRLITAPYFDWEYNAGTEFVKGRYYETRPNANRTENNYNPIYIKTQLLNL
ncbi:YjbH domain-containing protein [Ancylomarina sp. YFZ004]